MQNNKSGWNQLLNKSVKVHVLFLRGKLPLPGITEANDNHFLKKKKKNLIHGNIPTEANILWNLLYTQ